MDDSLSSSIGRPVGAGGGEGYGMLERGSIFSDEKSNDTISHWDELGLMLDNTTHSRKEGGKRVIVKKPYWVLMAIGKYPPQTSATSKVDNPVYVKMGVECFGIRLRISIRVG
jgi:hypothetical protein